MVAIDLPPGTLVMYIGLQRDQPTLCKIHPATVLATPIHVPDKQLLLYLGIVELGPFKSHSFFNGNQCAPYGKFFAHKFYYLDEMVYLIIDSPDKYYTVFRRNIVRIDNKANLCR